MERIRFRDASGQVRIGSHDNGTVLSGKRKYAFSDIDVLPPTNPEKVIVLDRNQERILPMHGFEKPTKPRFYTKTPNTVVGHGDTVEIPDADNPVVCEGELAAIVGQQCRNFSGENPEDVLLGYTCTNDLLVQGGFIDDPAEVKGNNFDTSNPVGPVVVPTNRITPTSQLTLRINGETVSETDFSTQIFSLSRILSDITQFVTLERGDVIIFGAPTDQFVITEGDTLEVHIEGIGTLENDVIRR